MSLTAEDKVFVLQRFVNSYGSDLLTLHAALVPSTPEAAQRFLIAGLNYALDKMDMVPDHRGPIGVADDAIMLRIATKLARAEGAKQSALEPLGLDANNVINLFEDLAAPLERLVALYQTREVRGRTPDKILTHNASRAAFDRDITNEAKQFKPGKIATTADSPRVITELYTAMKDTITKAKLHR
jgi:uncharacterized membrane protein YkvA (DUF1232 family)